MPLEVYEFGVTVAAGTLSTAPLVTPLAMPPREVRRLEIRVPPGPRGEVGFGLGQAGVKVLPQGDAQWVITDDEEIGWDLAGQVDSGAWECQAYNTGLYPHTIRVRFLVDLPAGPGAGLLTPLEPGLLTPA